MRTRKISRDLHQYELSSTHAPVAEVAPGERFVVDTHDCRTGTITRREQAYLLPDTRFVNPATGPIYVRGASTGMTLMIDLHSVSVAKGLGLMLTRPAATGLRLVTEPTLEIATIDGGFARVGRLSIRCMPMVGLIGVAPRVPAGTLGGGDHGGNMDTRLLTSGTRIYLPVLHDGALLYLGDVHAAMGDGEVFLTGVEVAGRIELTVNLLTDTAFPTPLIETPEVLATIATGPTLDDAATSAMMRAAELLTVCAGLSAAEAGFFMSAAGHLRVCQYLPGTTIHARFEVPFADLDASGSVVSGLGPRLKARGLPGSRTGQAD